MNGAKQEIVSLLEQVTGLNVDTVSDSTFNHAIQYRMDALHLEDMKAYVRTLIDSTDELRNLIEAVVVPETWFFRHQESFKILIKQLLQAKQNNRQLLFRILSLPCSTGEEPYSIIMALLQAGINPAHFHVMAVDISERALAVAQRGVYGKNSFRSKELSFRDTFFNRIDREFILKETVRSKVHFSQGNIMDSSFIATLGRFEIIFCRNILIYFGAETQKKVIDDFYNLLTPDGTLFTGHAEANLFLNNRFVRSPYANAFAFHKRKQTIGFATDHEHGTSNTKVDRVARTIQPLKTKKDHDTRPHVSLGATDATKPTFEAVMHMADAGKLTEAADCCEQHLQKSGPSTRWYYLLGVIRDSQDRPEEAVRLLRKALYLDPEHEESLFLLSLLAEQTGEHTKANNYKRRARKLRQRG